MPLISLLVADLVTSTLTSILKETLNRIPLFSCVATTVSGPTSQVKSTHLHRKPLDKQHSEQALLLIMIAISAYCKERPSLSEDETSQFNRFTPTARCRTLGSSHSLECIFLVEKLIKNKEFNE
jgi:hypothetical protein